MSEKPSHRKTARRVLKIEIDALEDLSGSLSDDFDRVIDLLTNLEGRIILAGVGKSGHVARKISATLASTGSPSLYVHPTEASHGDMGMIAKGDAVIALSRSGETKELSDMISYCSRFAVPLIAMTVKPDSTLGKAADFILALPDAPEACLETRAPTTSTTLQIALGDAIAVTLLEAKGFTAKDFKTFHPGGALGVSLATVSDLMHTDMPMVDELDTIETALQALSEKGFGCVGVMKDTKLTGIITDGDLRRNYAKVATASLPDIMTKTPKTAAPDELAANALRRMTGETPKITQLFVVDNDRPIGIVHLHDFLKAGLA